MKKTFTLLFFFALSFSAWSQDFIVTLGPGNTFNPADITITVGQTIEWQNSTGIGHNVNGTQTTFPSNPESFGNSVSANWTFQHTFMTAGSYDYHCDPHQNAGMTGTVTVMPAPVSALVIAGVADPQPTNGSGGNGAGPKSLELYVLADIADLSEYGIGVANNGGGTDSIEFTFPAVSAIEGDCIILTDTNNLASFQTFFGFDPDFLVPSGGTSAVGFNGDDAIELFQNGEVVDVYGDINMDGTGTAWDHVDGWAYRVSGTGPDGSTFVESNWVYSGTDALQSNTNTMNSEFANPFPDCSYNPIATPVTALIIAGVADPQPTNGSGGNGAGPKSLELYVLADIADLSEYGIGVANNGGGTDSIEFTFPAVSATEGDCIILTDTNNLASFQTFFGFDPDFLVPGGGSSAVGFNGDDAIELFQNGVVVDVYGDINMDGTGTAWDHVDGWAYRVSGTGPDGSTFVESNWIYSGTDALQSNTNTMNSEFPNPFPNCTYSPVASAVIVAVDDIVTVPADMVSSLNVLANDMLPNGIISLTVESISLNSISEPNGTTDITYTPNMGFCGPDEVIYEICDANDCVQATVSVMVECPISYPDYDIGVVTSDGDGDGVGDSLGVTCTLRGVVYGVDLRGGDGLSFTIIGSDGRGINVFNFNDVSAYVVLEGDEISVQGEIIQFSGLTEIGADAITITSTSNPLITPTDVTALGEDTESQLIRMLGMTIETPSQWLGDGSSYDVDITDGTNTFIMRIDDQVNLSSMPVPTGILNITGIGGQFDSSAPYNDGYQIFPRYLEDIEEAISTINPNLGNKIHFYPNPVSNLLQIDAEVELDKIRVTNVLGQLVTEIQKPNTRESINVSQLQSGVYLLTFVSGEDVWSSSFVKQ